MSVSSTTPSETVIAERYELKRRLAQGGMAEVWLAIDLTLDRKVAVKWLKPMLASDEVVAERFRREAIAAASLNHPNIVAVHDVFEHEGRQAVVMQLVDGKSLRQLLDTQKRLSPELTAHIGACTAAALDHAHENNFVHRDVKPGNIMITPDGRVLLTDFGIAKALQGGDDLTSENIMMGTAKYLSPEQVRGKKLDGRADLYSLGLVLYECLAGRVPFLGETDADTALARLQRDPTDLTRLRATLPTGLVTVIHQLLARNPMHRPATGSELATSLEAAAKEGPPPIDATPHERSPVAPFAAGRLRRAPSDLEGRSDDRRRGSRHAAAPEGSTRDVVEPAPTTVQESPAQPPTHNPAARIPGEPERITGTVPVQRNDSPPAQRDNTPSAGAAQRGEPARGMAQGWNPSLSVIGGLLLLAAIVAIGLWMSVRFSADDTSTLPEPVLPEEVGDANTGTDDPGAPVDAAATAAALDADSGANAAAEPDPIATGPVQIAQIRAYDPDGDFAENDGEASLALADGDPGTAWRTVCYGSKFLGGKQGVGLVVSLDQLGQPGITVDVQHGPYQVDFFTSADEAVPATFDGWSNQLGERQFAAEPETIESGVAPTPIRHILVLVKELGSDETCTANNPFRGRLGEIALTS